MKERSLILCEIAVIGGSNLVCSYPFRSLPFEKRVDYMRDEIYFDSYEIKRQWRKEREAKNG